MKLHQRADGPRRFVIVVACKRLDLFPGHITFPKVLHKHAVASQQTMHIIFMILNKRWHLHTPILTEVDVYA